MGKKRILSGLLAVCMILCMTVCAQAGIASKVKVTFNGKTIVFNSKSEPKTLKQLEKIWGKKTGTPDEDDGSGYVWEKGGTKLEIDEGLPGKGLGYIAMKITDQNAAIAGVKVGMTKDEALNKLKKIYGGKCVVVLKEGQDWDFYEEDSYIVTGKPLSDKDECINVLRGHYFPIYFYLADGKVSEIQWMRL